MNIISWGVSADMPFSATSRIRLINVFALLASMATLPYIFIFFQQGNPLTAITLFFFLIFCSTLLWNRFGKYQIAKFWLYISAHLYLFTTASSFGREAGEHLALIPVLFGAVLVFEFQEKKSLIFAICFTLITLLSLELTGFALFKVNISPTEALEFYRGNLIITFVCSIAIAVFYFFLYGRQLKENKEMIETSKEIEYTINYFSTSLFGKNSIDEVLWDVAKNCIGRIGLVDCVIYLVDESGEKLTQKAAYGAKNPREFEIFQPIEIPMGKGIVGSVAVSGEAIIVADTSKDPRYIPDDQNRLSELAVPLVYNRQVIGVIDSEHPQKNFFSERHLNILKTIAALCANKVARALADEEREKALKVKLEAEKIKAFDELKSRLFANISHELRTPLTLINGTVEKHLANDPSTDWRLMKQHTDRLLRLINQLLDLTKLESGSFRLQEEPGDIHAFFRLTLSLFESQASSKMIRFDSNIPETPLWLFYDQDVLEKIVHNLLSNAIKFSGKNTTITIQLNYKQGLHFKIKDQGKGIPQHELERIFDRFYQGSKNDPAGTGIGLALTRELIEVYKGTIGVDSHPGKGSVFTVILPLKPAEPATGLPPDSQEDYELRNLVSQRKKRSPAANLPEEVVMLVEDNEELARFVESELESSFSVIRFSDGVSAVHKAEELLPDLIISDVMMPGMSGIELCKAIKENEVTSHIPVILLTARADMETKLEGLQTGADDYIVKPFHPEELNTRTSNLMEQRKKLREKYQKIIELKPQDVVITSAEEVFLKRLQHVVMQNLSNGEFSINQLCLEIGLSRMQLHRKLTALTGHSATSFIRHQRLVRAGQLLESGEAVSQVAYSVGFSSLSYFSKAFKEQFGHLPSEFPLRVS